MEERLLGESSQNQTAIVSIYAFATSLSASYRQAEPHNMTMLLVASKKGERWCC